MVVSHVQGDTVAWSAGISACEKGFAWCQALQLLEEMSCHRMSKDAAAHVLATIIRSVGHTPVISYATTVPISRVTSCYNVLP